MVIKEELLNITQSIYEQELGISWPATQTIQTSWKPFAETSPNRLAISSFSPRVQLGRITMVEGVRLILNDGDMSLHVRRTDPAEGYENDFIADYFLKPFQAFLHEHDHDMCQAIHESQAAQAASEAPPRQPSIYDGVPVKITNKRKIA